MERMLVLQHVEHEGPGRYAALARCADIELDVVRLWEGAAVPGHRGYSRLLVMGGPHSAYDNYPARDGELRAIQDFVGNRKQVLGVCLGGQLGAYAGGGRVMPAAVDGRPVKEVGFYPVQRTKEKHPLLVGLPDEFRVFQWHGDMFVAPPGSQVLAQGSGLPQAFAYKTMVGVLFHLEMTPGMIERLVRVDAEWMGKGVDGEGIVAEAYRCAPLMDWNAQVLFTNWLASAER